jgi:hypothetical protein
VPACADVGARLELSAQALWVTGPSSGELHRAEGDGRKWVKRMASVRTADSLDSESAQRWVSLTRATGVTGLAAVILLFAALGVIGSADEPPLDATSQEAATFFRNSQAALVQAAGATVRLATLVFLWFVVGLTLLLRRAEGEPPWRSTVALVSGVLFAAYGVLDASSDAAAHRGTELSPGIASYAFDLGNIGFANAWLAVASLAVSSGWVTVRTGVLPRWTGWCAIASGVGLIVVRYFWFVGELWLLPYGLFWLWVVASCVRLVRHPREVSRPPGNR